MKQMRHLISAEDLIDAIVNARKASFNSAFISYDAIIAELNKLTISAAARKVTLTENRSLSSQSQSIFIDATKDALFDAVNLSLRPFDFTPSKKDIRVSLYSTDQAGVDRYIVEVDGYGVFGFLDGDIED